MMKKILTAFFVFASLFASTQIWAQNAESTITKANLSSAEIEKIIAGFSAKEAEFRRALNQYGFRREAIMQRIGFGGQVAAEFRRDSIFLFREDNTRFEKVVFAPVSTFSAVSQTDIDDLGGVNQFALEPNKISQYNFTFIGKEKIDELELYVFDVAPKVMPDPKKTKERFFQGRVWVDDQDLQIVKTKGKGVPETKKEKFPVVETWRENVDGKYWFPAMAYANDQLYFESSGETLHVKMKVKYSEYRLPRTSVKIIEEEDTPEEEPKKP